MMSPVNIGGPLTFYRAHKGGDSSTAFVFWHCGVGVVGSSSCIAIR